MRRLLLLAGWIALGGLFGCGTAASGNSPASIIPVQEATAGIPPSSQSPIPASPGKLTGSGLVKFLAQLKPGESTVRELSVKAGAPSQTRELGDGSAYRYPSQWALYPHTVAADPEGVVQFAAIENVSFNFFTLRELQAELGLPVQAQLPGILREGLEFLFFSGKGTAVIMDRIPPRQILYLQRFPEAMTLAQYQERLGFVPEMFGSGLSPAPAAPPTPVPSRARLPEETPMPPDPVRVEFTSEDGTSLVGTYFHAGKNPAPVVVLMHALGGGKGDWGDAGLVEWLRNRGVSNPRAPAGLYPPMPERVSFAVFVFDYRGHGESGWTDDDPQGWLLDGMAAMETARRLPGVDGSRAIALGASIGADGAIDACGEGCLGALSLSPDGFMNVPYHNAVAALAFEGKPAWCVASVFDKGCPPRAQGLRYRAVVYPGSRHGMDLLDPGLTPNVGGVILEFLMECLQT